MERKEGWGVRDGRGSMKQRGRGEEEEGGREEKERAEGEAESKLVLGLEEIK